MISSIISRLVILIFGTLYPAYASYKAVRTKNLKEYVKWMMYWIVFALFTCTETFTDVFLSWFPFYYEVKIVLVLWLLSPATKGSSILYRKFVHPALCRREQEIDEYIAKAKDQGYHTVLNLGTKGVNYATTVIMQTAIKGGGGLVQQLRRSYSLSDLTECDSREERSPDETDDVLAEPRLIRKAIKSAYAARRSASESNSRQPMYFPEVDVDVRSARATRSDVPDLSHVKSSEDISSGYSSAENSASLARAGAGSRRARPARVALTAIKRPQPAEESEVIIEELHDTDIFEYSNMPPLVNVPSPLLLSQTDPPFIYQCVGGKINILQVLGNFPLFTNNVLINNNCPDERDQEASSKENEINVINYSAVINEGSKDTCNETLEENSINKNDQIKGTISEIINDEIETKISLNCANANAAKENISLNMVNTNSEESDDEASFGTPDNSPKSKRKCMKGKYGKSKAPLPPIPTKIDDSIQQIDHKGSSQSEENLVDIKNKSPNLDFKDTQSIISLHVINPITQRKNRHKSRSPGIVSKANSSGIIKLLQLPSKLAFWHKSDDIKKDNTSASSGDHSRRSSTVEKMLDECQSCTDLIAPLDNMASHVTELQANDKFNELHLGDIDEDSTVTKGVMEKSDALQKIINAKLESHPEYKFVSLHNDLAQTTSKSTEV